jgi:hypothetical protein
LRARDDYRYHSCDESASRRRRILSRRVKGAAISIRDFRAAVAAREGGFFMR